MAVAWGHSTGWDFQFLSREEPGALGDAGAVVTDNPEVWEKIRLWRNHGAPRKYYHDLVGFNYRMDSLTGAVLSIKLSIWRPGPQSARARAALYREELAAAVWSCQAGARRRPPCLPSVCGPEPGP